MAFEPKRCSAEARLFCTIDSSLLADRIAASPQMALRQRETTFGRHFRTSPDSSSSRNMTRCSAHSIWHMPIKNLFNESFLCSFENSY